MKNKIISLLLTMLFIFSPFSVIVQVSSSDSDYVLPFSDVEKGKWYFDAIRDSYEAGYLQGKSETVFDPSAKMTRAEIVTLLSRMAKADVAGMENSSSFSDVKKTSWYAPYVGWGVETGIVNGYEDGTFKPSKNITRTELAALFSRLIKYLELVPEGPVTDDLFGDEDSLPGWGRDDIYFVKEYGLVKGDNKGNFNPKDSATRAELASIASRMISYLELTVMKDGKSDYKIVTSDMASKAAERLIWQAEKLTGTTLSLAGENEVSEHEIVLGKTDRVSPVSGDDLGEEGFAVCSDGKKIFVEGASSEDIYKGVTALLKGSRITGSSFFVSKNLSVIKTKEYPVGKLRINGNDISKYVIVYPSDAAPSVMTGVNDIQKYIEKACGAKLPLTTERKSPAIIIDQSTVEIEGSYNFGEENYSVKSNGDDIIIKGSGTRGAMYGCYAFLEEQIGWNFLTPEVDYIEPAEEKNITDVDTTYSPYFEYRHNLWGTHSQEFFAKKQLNGNTTSEEYGGGIHYTGRSCHTFEVLTNGEYSQYSAQPCLNDDEVYETILGNVLKLLEANPDAKIISVSQNDNSAYCTCEKCTAIAEEEGGQSGNIIRFVNKIADAVKEAGYDKVSIHTFAYLYSTDACKTKPRDNVIVQYCVMSGCFAHTIDDPSCRMYSNSFHNAISIDGWSKICGRIWIWDYFCHFGAYLQATYNYRYEVMCRNIRYYYEHGVSGIFNEGPYNSAQRTGEFSEMRFYLLSECMKNPFMTEEEYYQKMYTFLKGYYGEDAAPYIYEYINKVLEDKSCDDWMNSQNRDALFWALRFRSSLEMLGSCFDNALLNTDTYYEWECADLDRMQLTYISISYEFMKLRSDEEKFKDLQIRSFEFSEKLKAYNIRKAEGIVFRFFNSPDEITCGPSEW